MNSKIISIVTGATIVIILMATLLVPALNDAQNAGMSKAQNTDELYNAEYIDLNSSYTLDYADGDFTVNGVPQHLTTGRMTILTDVAYILTTNGAPGSNPTFVVYCEGAAANGVSATKVVIADHKVTYTASGTDTAIEGLTWGIVPDIDGSLGAFASSTQVHVSRNADYFIAGYGSGTSEESNAVKFAFATQARTLADETSHVAKFAELAVSSGTYAEAAATEISNAVTYNAVGAVVTSTASFTLATEDDTLVKENANLTLFAEMEFIAESGSNNAVMNLLYVIPVMIVVAVLLSAVSIIVRRD